MGSWFCVAEIRSVSCLIMKMFSCYIVSRSSTKKFCNFFLPFTYIYININIYSSAFCYMKFWSYLSKLFKTVKIISNLWHWAEPFWNKVACQAIFMKTYLVYSLSSFFCWLPSEGLTRMDGKSLFPMCAPFLFFCICAPSLFPARPLQNYRLQNRGLLLCLEVLLWL